MLFSAASLGCTQKPHKPNAISMPCASHVVWTLTFKTNRLEQSILAGIFIRLPIAPKPSTRLQNFLPFQNVFVSNHRFGLKTDILMELCCKVTWKLKIQSFTYTCNETCNQALLCTQTIKKESTWRQFCSRARPLGCPPNPQLLNMTGRCFSPATAHPATLDHLCLLPCPWADTREDIVVNGWFFSPRVEIIHCLDLFYSSHWAGDLSSPSLHANTDWNSTKTLNSFETGGGNCLLLHAIKNSLKHSSFSSLF